jgi:fibronectin-binding autotransporter adhesin
MPHRRRKPQIRPKPRSHYGVWRFVQKPPAGSFMGNVPPIMSRLASIALLAVLAILALPVSAQVSLRPSSEFAPLPEQHSYIIGLIIKPFSPQQALMRPHLITTQESYISPIPHNQMLGWQKEFDLTPFNTNLYEDSLVVSSPVNFPNSSGTYFFTGGLSLNRSIRFQQSPIAIVSNTRIGNFGQVPNGLALRDPTSSGEPINVFYSIDGQDGSTPGLYRHGDVTTTWTALPENTFGNSGPGQVTSGVGALQFGPDGLLNVIDTGAQRIFRYDPDTLAYVGEVVLDDANTNRGAFIITPNGHIMTTFTDSAGGAIYDYATGAFLGTYGTYSANDLHPQNGFGGKTSMSLDPDTGLVYVYHANPDGSEGLFTYDSNRLLDSAFTDPARLTVSHSGEFTLAGDNHYPSGIVFGAGALILGSAGALGSEGTISFSGGTMKFSAANTTDYSPRFSTAPGQQYAFDTNGQNVTLASALTSDGGSLTKLGTGTLALSGTNTYTGGTTLAAGTLQLDSAGALGSTGTISFEGGILRFSAANATDYSARFSNAPGQLYAFDTNGQDVTLATALTSAGGSLTKIGAGALDLGANTLHLGGVIMSGGTLQNGTLHLTSPLDARTGVISATLAGSSSLIKTTTGTLALSGTNTYAGGTTLAAGTLQLDSAQALGSTGTIRFEGGILRFSAANTTDYSSRFSTDGSQQYAFDTNGQDVAFATALTGDYSTLTKNGAGTLFLSGTDTYGGITLNAGTLDLGGNTQSIDAVTVNGGTLQNGTVKLFFSTFDARAGLIAATLTGPSSSLVKTTAGTLTLTGVNTYTSGTTIHAGVLQLGDSGTVLADTGAVTLTGGTLRLGAADETIGSLAGSGGTVDLFNGSGRTLTLGDNTSTTFAGIIQGDGGSLVKTGSGTLVLSGASTYSGVTTLRAGTLGLGSAGALGSTGTISFEGGMLQFSAANTLDYSSRFSTAAGQQYWIDTHGQNVTFATALTSVGSSLIKTGAGTLDLGGNSQFFDAVTLNGGTLQNGTLYFATPLDVRAGTLSVALAGSSSLNKTTGDTVVLSGANTYTGGTTLAAGTLQLDSAGALGSTGTISFEGGTLRFSAANTHDYSARFSTALGQQYRFDTNGQNVTFATALTSDGGSLTKGGEGTLTLAVANAYTGDTTINTGTLDLGGNTLLLGNVIVAGGTLQNGTLNLSSPLDARAGIISATLSGSSSLIKTTTGTLTLSGSHTYTGGTTIDAGILQLGDSGTVLADTGAITLTGGTLRLGAADETIGSLAGSGGTVDLFNGSGRTLTLGDNTSTTFAGIIQGDGGSLVKIGTGTFTLTGTNTYSGNTTLESGILQLGDSGTVLADTGTVTINGGTLQLSAANETIGSLAGSGGTIDLFNGGGRTLTVGGDNSTSFAGLIQGDGGSLVKTGSGTLALTASHTYTGGTTINAGVLQLGDSGSVLSDAGLVTINGGTLQLGAANETIGSLAGSGGTVDLFNASGRTLTLGNSSSTTFAGIIQGDGGSLVKNGSGTLTLSGANTYSGNTVLRAGTLALGSAQALGSTGTISFEGGALQFSAANTADYSARFSNAASQQYLIDTNGQNITLASALTSNGGSLIKNGAGTLTLSGANTYNGGTTLNAGILDLGGTTQSLGAFTMSDGALINGTLNSSSPLTARAGTILATLAGSSSLSKTTNGILTIGGSNTYTGGTTLTDGTIILASAGALGSTGTISFEGGTLQFSADNTTDYSSRFSNAAGQQYSINIRNRWVVFATGLSSEGGSLSVRGSGTLELTGTNTYTGPTIIDGARLLISNPGSVFANSGDVLPDTSAVILINDSRLQFGVANETIGSLSGSVESVVDLGFNAGNSLTLGGDNSSTTFFGRIEGNGSIIKTGTGTFTLAGPNVSGNTIINAGTLQIGDSPDSWIGGGRISGSFVNHAILAFNRSDASTLSNAISGTGSFIQRGTGAPSPATTPARKPSPPRWHTPASSAAPSPPSNPARISPPATPPARSPSPTASRSTPAPSSTSNSARSATASTSPAAPSPAPPPASSP